MSSWIARVSSVLSFSSCSPWRYSWSAFACWNADWWFCPIITKHERKIAYPDHPASEPLIRLLELSFGPRHLIADEFEKTPGASEVMIFGSWAARHAGEAGATPHDIDVLVVGEGVARAGVYEAADRAQARLGLPVNPTIRTSAQWADVNDPLSSQIRSSPTLTLIGEEDVDGALAAR